MYADGRGPAGRCRGRALVPATVQSDPEAVRGYRLAAEQGDAMAQFALGVMYANGGAGVPQDVDEAVRWYRLAAEQGDADAQLNLALIYSNGHGITRGGPRPCAGTA